MIKRHSFSLLEVVIALSICMLCFSMLAQGTTRHLKNQMLLLKQIEAERLIELSYFELLQSWIKNGRFEGADLECAPHQQALLLDHETILERTIKLTKSHLKTSTQNEQWKKLTYQIRYPKLKVSAKYHLLVKRVDKKFE